MEKNSSYVHKPWYQQNLGTKHPCPLWGPPLGISDIRGLLCSPTLNNLVNDRCFPMDLIECCFFLCQSQTISMSGGFVFWEFLVFPSFSWDQSIKMNKSFPQYHVSLILVSGFYSPSNYTHLVTIICLCSLSFPRKKL